MRISSALPLLVLLASTSMISCNDDSKSGGNKSPDSGADDDDSDSGDGSDGGGESNGSGQSGGGAVDNVGACEDFVDSWSCADIDIAQAIRCDVLGSAVCDISDYFNCLTDNATCDAVAWSNAVNQCAPKAACS